MFDSMPIAVAHFWQMNLWYAVPAIVAISLVYSATRHERLLPILSHAVRGAVWIVGFMLVVFLVLQAMNWYAGP